MTDTDTAAETPAPPAYSLITMGGLNYLYKSVPPLTVQVLTERKYGSLAAAEQQKMMEPIIYSYFCWMKLCGDIPPHVDFEEFLETDFTMRDITEVPEDVEIAVNRVHPQTAPNRGT